MSDAFAWPTAGPESRPWTRWWWLANAVDETNLTSMLAEFRAAGIGGVEICPIYGVKGYEGRFVQFLSPRWMELFDHTAREARRLGLGLDLTTGTGWPFGGPRVSAEEASTRIRLKAFEMGPDESLAGALPKGALQCLMARSDRGEQLDLTDKVRNGELQWAAPAGHWRLYALTAEGTLQKVKRAAPGGEGDVLNPYYIRALDQYLADFDKAFAAGNAGMPRAQFHDSFEYYHADWSPDFFEQFEKRRGYDVRTQLPALLGEGDAGVAERVQHDYRETLSDMHIAWIERWTRWAHEHGCLTRNQAHGAPANLVDLYAAADIPETEIFGGLGEQNILMNKLASSAAHLRGRKLSSSESFTWLTEHFQANLDDVKKAADYLFLSGANHLLFHGIPYSPAEAAWPGWQFYAAVNFGPRGGLWRDLPLLNAYLTRCQSVLQSGAPANDVLVYFPVHDFWQTSGNLLMPFTVEQANRWLQDKAIHNTATFLWEQGYGYDALSDRFVQEAEIANGRIVLNGNSYGVILVPQSKYLPANTLRKLVDLARRGGTVLIENKLPEDAPGYGGLENRRAQFRQALAELKFQPGEIQRAAVGEGRFLLGTNLNALLRAAGVAREPCVDLGLRFVRRSHADGCHYFFANRGQTAVDGWVTLGTRATSALLLDPRVENRIGVAALKQDNLATQVHLQLQPGESLVLKTFTNRTAIAAPWRYFESAGSPQKLGGQWTVRFIEGGPELPPGYQTGELESWTGRDNSELKRFAGTARYTIEFEKPSVTAEDWVLDLGRVCETARVKLNGQDAGALWFSPFQIPVGRFLRPGRNILEIEVTNLAANRIRDLDQRKVNWKYFYDINLVGRDYRLLDASAWPLRDSGLLGPVVLKPVKLAVRK